MVSSVKRRVSGRAARGLSRAGGTIVYAAIAFATTHAAAQTSDQTPPPSNAPNQPAEEITITAQRLNAARNNIEPGIGASSYDFSRDAIENQPGGGENAGLNQVLLQAPGVAQDNLANGAFHIRDEHLAVQYRINGVIIPDGVSFFGQGLSPRFVDSMKLLTGALPAEYGLRTAGVVDIQTKSGVFQNGGSVGMYGGSYWTLQPSAEYGGNWNGLNYYASGDFLHSEHGINSPVSNYNAIHDETNQEHGFAYLEKIIDPSSKVSVFGGSFYGWFQIPNNPGQQDNPNLPAFTTVDNLPAFDSNALKETQIETSHFAVASYLRSEQDLDYQISFFTKYSTLRFSPDIYGDLFFGGVAQYALRQDFTNGIQAEGTYRLTSDHTLRGGVIASGEKTSADTTSWVTFNTDATNTPTPIIDNHEKTGWTYSTFLQDEFKVLPSVTLNYGGRFDAIDTSAHANQLSPRFNVVWQALQATTVHAGYANYFSPPPFDIISLTSTNKFIGTSGVPLSLTNSAVKPERSHVFDVGVDQDVLPGLKVGIDAYYKYARNLIDESQFGAPVILTPFNYHVGYTKGVELTTTFDSGPFTYYGNLAIAQEKAEQITSAQFNFTPDDLAYIATHKIHTDHDQLMTASAGMSYLWEGTRFAVDIIAGSGVRTTPNGGTPNGSSVPSYEQVNFGVSHRFEDAPGGPVEVRADLINVLDETYLIREQSGIGVGAPQFGPRRTFFMGVRKFFD